MGRILIAYFFIPSGINRMMEFAGVNDHVSSAGPHLSSPSALLATVIEVGFGCALLFGVRPRLTGTVLAIFSLCAAFFFHRFWAASETQYVMEKLAFDQDVAIAGGLLLFSSIEAGFLKGNPRPG